MQLTDHFSLAELIASTEARKRDIDNTPSAETVDNLRRLAQTLEQARVLLGGKPILVSSGYRCPALNRAVGGVSDSAHLHGLAADFVCPAFGSPLEVVRKLAASNLPFDQVIHEGGRWVHIGLAADGKKPRRQVLTANFSGEHATYTVGA
ncbi:D-Ala-D-Ala carboxypeptidase family metallohydrolase [Burkholderia contaminans]|uniref:Peptidase M15 n=1 Tax=Burkholderia contaminans TaxID=488447 RepID=A0A3N8PFC0_9BURK|nr:D-Ala-D-Ala carboxypeptidase family metallohydrolase [Burkholderia contaminans]RQT09820.1 peptidase M15 [Burkholderia contaminans]